MARRIAIIAGGPLWSDEPTTPGTKAVAAVFAALACLAAATSLWQHAVASGVLLAASVGCVSLARKYYLRHRDAKYESDNEDSSPRERWRT